MGVTTAVFEREGYEHSDIDIFSNFAILSSNSHAENFSMLDDFALMSVLPLAGRS